MEPSSKRQARDDKKYLRHRQKNLSILEKLCLRHSSVHKTVSVVLIREKKLKKFLSHICEKTSPDLIRKFQWRCGKRITAEDPPIIIRSTGESWWTDKTTGKEISRVGPMYVHFNQNCLEQFETEKFYYAAKRFDLSRMIINEDNYKELHEKERKELRDLGITFL